MIYLILSKIKYNKFFSNKSKLDKNGVAMKERKESLKYLQFADQMNFLSSQKRKFLSDKKKKYCGEVLKKLRNELNK